MSRSYPVGIAGESHFQEAIALCDVGDAVEILWEQDNPHDSQALACFVNGRRIGYIPMENWVQSAVHDDGYSCSARIKAFNSGDLTGVVLDVSTISGPIAQVSYSLRDRPAPRGCMSWLI